MSTELSAFGSIEIMQRELNYIKKCFENLENENRKLTALNEREEALLKMYRKLDETDQQIIYGLVTRFYNKEVSF